MARHLGTDHHERILDVSAARTAIPEVCGFLDEPFADASIVPTYLLAQFTREHVTVALSGDGGDELFAGYPTFKAIRLARLYNLLVPVVRGPPPREAVGGAACVRSSATSRLDFKANQFLRGAKSNDDERLHGGSDPSSRRSFRVSSRPSPSATLDPRSLYDDVR